MNNWLQLRYIHPSIYCIYIVYNMLSLTTQWYQFIPWMQNFPNLCGFSEQIRMRLLRAITGKDLLPAATGDLRSQTCIFLSTHIYIFFLLLLMSVFIHFDIHVSDLHAGRKGGPILEFWMMSRAL